MLYELTGYNSVKLLLELKILSISDYTVKPEVYQLTNSLFVDIYSNDSWKSIF